MLARTMQTPSPPRAERPDVWPVPARHPPLLGDVHVWRARLALAGASLEQLASVLSEDERARAARLLVDSARRGFVVTRGLLRVLLGRYLDRPPAAIALTYGPAGKPALARDTGPDALHFNVSHSGDTALLAFGPRRLGVDVERLDHRADHRAIARRFFAPAEAEELAALPEPAARRRFFDMWTRREALLKATGKGWTEVEPTLDADALGFSVWPLRVTGYAAALAVEGTTAEPPRRFAPPEDGRHDG